MYGIIPEDYAKSTGFQQGVGKIRGKNRSRFFAAIFRIFRLIARCSKYDFWSLRNFLHRHRSKIFLENIFSMVKKNRKDKSKKSKNIFFEKSKISVRIFI